MNHEELEKKVDEVLKDFAAVIQALTRNPDINSGEVTDPTAALMALFDSSLNTAYELGWKHEQERHNSTDTEERRHRQLDEFEALFATVQPTNGDLNKGAK
jgi:hypothetical protein